jgi:hypothetical protein
MDDLKEKQQKDKDKEKDFNNHFKEDMLRLLYEYNQLDSFRYSDFVSLWNEMKFYLLLA